MKRFNEFKSDQQYITEIGPIAATLAGAAGLIGGYFAAKKLKDKFASYRENKKEKEENQKRDVYVNIKKWDDDAGKIVTQSVLFAPAGSKKARISNDDLEKEQKKLQKKEDPRNSSKEGEYDAKEKESEVERGGIEDVKDAEEYYKNNGEAPKGWRNAGSKEKPELMITKDYDKEMKRRKNVAKKGPTPDERKKQAATKAKLQKRKKERDTGVDIKKQQFNSKLLNFAEFIAEDIMKDLKQIIKSKRDTEVKLDDGSAMPIDPMTADIFVKYIEGLKSSEQKKVINQIQRTERGFMKVLGKAHGE